LPINLETILESSGSKVTGTASTAAAARDICRSAMPDLAFIDLHLRDGLAGLDLAVELAQAGVLNWFITANDDQCHSHVAFAVGCVPKPYTETSVIRALEISKAIKAGHGFPDSDYEGLVLYQR
jgi:two-component system, response regulator PdtaR